MATSDVTIDDFCAEGQLGDHAGPLFCNDNSGQSRWGSTSRGARVLPGGHLYGPSRSESDRWGRRMSAGRSDEEH